MCPSLIQIGLKTAEKTLHKQTNKQTYRQTNRHYENNGHLAVNEQIDFYVYFDVSLFYEDIVYIYVNCVCHWRWYLSVEPACPV